ncbi:tetratricopeptide repeat protein [Lentzea sp. NEAU-D7]|uniref:tetratricopeptide repeat protein n=1 Tax=Lentzea sp. NEAU-D7 TaxID=2994667 RepID=UPI00224AA5D1|nr:tetratricopeptide repeat protein [Lentzea sp. NEAU-D7]MCX2948965.1 tetratricopeptide repeat protein [Lentzea sp. NEAU-D7]
MSATNPHFCASAAVSARRDAFRRRAYDIRHHVKVSISDKDRKILWGRSGNRCALCRQLLVAQRTSADEDAVVGDEAHIAARSPGGPRYGEGVPAAIDGYANLILLCRVDHKRVDDQPVHYTATRLRKIKTEHEAWVEHALVGQAPRLRVREVSPRELGVHAAIQVRDTTGELPAYVTRDVDAKLRAKLAPDIGRGCFLLLVGSSSVGKTRTASEAIRECFPDWWLIQPENADETRALASAPVAQTVVWLDELQRYLGHQGTTAETVRALCRAGMVVIATLWPDIYLTRMVPRQPGSADMHRADRELLSLATVIDISDTLTAEELGRAAALAATDNRIREALTVTDAGLIQVLAAGPALIRWWEYAPTPYARAIITAAADARRLGVWSPLTREFLAAAAVGYLTAAQRAAAPPDWLDAALSYALVPLHGAASTLTPVPVGDDVAGPIAGYMVADYVLQYARRARRTVSPPAACWKALVAHETNNDDLRRLAHAARARLRHHYAESFYRRLVDDGDADAAHTMAVLLAQQKRTDEAIAVLRPHAEAGVWFATAELVGLLRSQNRMDEAITVLRLPRRDSIGIDRLVDLLVELDREDDAVDVLREHTRTGGYETVDRFAELLVRLGRTDEAIDVLRLHADDNYLLWRLACLFAHVGRFDEAIEVLVAHPEAGADRGPELLVDLLARQGRINDLWVRAEAGDEVSLWRLADVLSEQGKAEQLSALLDSHRDDPHFTLVVSHWLACVLAEQGRVDDLHVRADAGDKMAGFELADLLIDQGHLDQLRARADAGDRAATWRLAQHMERSGHPDDAITVLRGYPDEADVSSFLANLLMKQGRVDEAIEALQPAADINKVIVTERVLLNNLLAQQGRVEELRARADTGDRNAVWRLADQLENSDHVDETIELLWAHADDDHSVAFRLAELLAKNGRITSLRARADAGDKEAAGRLAGLLAQHGLLDELRMRADAGQLSSHVALLDLLVQQDRTDELGQRADAGDKDAARHLVDLLADQARIDELRAEVDAGTDGAIEKFTALLFTQGKLSRREAAHIHAFGFNADGSVCYPTDPADGDNLGLS